MRACRNHFAWCQTSAPRKGVAGKPENRAGCTATCRRTARGKRTRKTVLQGTSPRWPAGGARIGAARGGFGSPDQLSAEPSLSSTPPDARVERDGDDIGQESSNQHKDRDKHPDCCRGIDVVFLDRLNEPLAHAVPGENLFH